MENILPLSSQINWNATWKYLNNNNKRSSLFTNFKLLQEKTFKIKLMLKILPTMLHFHSLYPLIYPNSNCPSCNRCENEVHWLMCPNISNLNTIISSTIQQFFHQTRLDITNSKLQELHTKLNNH